MGFPGVIVECAFNSILPEATTAPTGFTDITKYVDEISGTLRGRSYELDDIETGSITLVLDNADGRFTPGSPLSPYFPYVKANRRLRIRGLNMQRPNVARTGGAEQSTIGFFRAPINVLDVSDGVTMRVSTPSVVTHNPVTLGFSGDLLKETAHIEGTLKSGATAGNYRVISFYVPIELGVRLAHSAYVWRVSGTEPSGTSVAIYVDYFDSEGNFLTKVDNGREPGWTSPMSTSPQSVSWSELPNGDAAYAMCSVWAKLTNTAASDVTYAIFGIQTELPTANLSPSISGWYDAAAWGVDGSGAITKGGTGSSNAYLITTWAADDTELAISVPHLVPGDDYTFVVEAQKSGGPNVLLSADDGLTGVTLSSNTTWSTMRVTFTATDAEQNIKLIPQGTVVAGQTLWLRLARCSYSDAALALAAFASDANATTWQRPIPVFDGWVEIWPIKTTASSSSITITVNDRLKKLGEVSMESTLKQTLITDSPVLLIPFTDSSTDAQGKVSIQGDWADDADASQVAPTQTKNGAGSAVYGIGTDVGPTDEDALKITQATAQQGYVLYLPYSADYVAPSSPPVVAPKPVPKPTVKTTYKRTYYATWSRSYDGSNATRFDDPPTLYQGDDGTGSGNGNQRSLIGFNWNAINADLKGASVLGATVTLHALHWWFYDGGTVYVGYHTNTSKPSTFSASTVRRWKMKMPKNASRTLNIGAAGGVLFQKGQAKGLTIGYGNGDDHETYGYLSGATMSYRPYITITFKK